MAICRSASGMSEPWAEICGAEATCGRLLDTCVGDASNEVARAAEWLKALGDAHPLWLDIAFMWGIHVAASGADHEGEREGGVSREREPS